MKSLRGIGIGLMLGIVLAGCGNNLESEKLIPEEASQLSEETEVDMDAMDLLAGYNDQAVMENLSEDGKELFGKWVFKNDYMGYRIYNEDYTFMDCKDDKGTDYAEGTWEYDQANRLIIHKLSKFIDNGQDITSEIGPQLQSFQVKNFDKRTLYGIVLEVEGLRTLIKED